MGFAFHRPETIDAAIGFARKHGEAARFLAGGTDLIIQINRRRLAPQHLISLAGLGLDSISETPTEVVIGAMATHDAVVSWPGFQKELLALAAGFRRDRRPADPQHRHRRRQHRQRLAGSRPRAGASGARCHGRSARLGGSRSLPLDRFLVERGRTDRRPDEILTAVRFDKPPAASATWFLKAGRRKAMEISVICVAAHLVQSGKARIAIGAAASRTVRVPEAEALVEKQWRRRLRRGRRGSPPRR